MAFNKTTFKCIASGASSNVFTYDGGADTIATIAASGYFTPGSGDEVRYTLHQGDLIIAVGATGVSGALLTVTSASGASPATVARAGFG